jgi:GAF domain-containing protein
MVGELVPVLTGTGTLDERLRVVAHRITLGGGYSAVSFEIFERGFDPNGHATVGENAFTRAPRELIEEWSEYQRTNSERPANEVILRTRKAVVIDDIQTSDLVSPPMKELLGKVGILSGIVVPLFSDNELIATMSVGKSERGAFTSDDEGFLTAVAQQIAGLVDLMRRAERASISEGARGADERAA